MVANLENVFCHERAHDFFVADVKRGCRVCVCVHVCYAVVTTTFDCSSDIIRVTVDVTRTADPLAAVTLTYLFI